LKSSTLEELEGKDWGDPQFPSHLVTECHRLRRVPIGELSVENLRIMLGQGLGVKHLLPLAIEVLEKDPLAEGDFYPGDLLGSVLRLPAKTWVIDCTHAQRVDAIMKSLIDIPDEIIEEATRFVSRNV